MALSPIPCTCFAVLASTICLPAPMALRRRMIVKVSAQEDFLLALCVAHPADSAYLAHAS
eukprot:269576-Chlamydomonas_euryale.AAC.2